MSDINSHNPKKNKQSGFKTSSRENESLEDQPEPVLIPDQLNSRKSLLKQSQFNKIEEIQLADELEPALILIDTKKGQWKQERSINSKQSQFADQNFKGTDKQIDDELEPVLNKSDLVNSSKQIRDSQFKNQMNIDVEEVDDDHHHTRDEE